MSNSSEEISNWVQGSYKVRRTLNTSGEGIQHVKIDIGSGTTESLVTSGNPLPTTTTISGTPNINVVTWGSATTESILDDFSTPHAAITVMGWDHSTPRPIAIPVAAGAGGSGYEVQASYHQRTQGIFPPYGKIAGTSLTTSYATLVTTSGNVRGFTIMNSCDQAVIITLDGGSTNNIELEAFESHTADLASLGVYLNSSTIQAKHAGTLPKVGSVRCWIVK